MSWTHNSIGTLIELPTDLKLYKDQNKRQAFLGYKVKTSGSKRVRGNTTHLPNHTCGEGSALQVHSLIM